MVDFALGQCHDVDLRPPPSFCAARIVICRCVSARDIRDTVVATSQSDADDNHVKRDGNDWRNLVTSNNVSMGPFLLRRKARGADQVQHHELTVASTYKAYQRYKKGQGVD